MRADGLRAVAWLGSPAPPDWASFDPAAAHRVCVYFEGQGQPGDADYMPASLCHAKGEWAGQPFRLLDWQRAVLWALFGWKRPDGRRLYEELWAEISKKNGKSEFAAGIALYMLDEDREPSAEVYSLAADRDQAAIVFNTAAYMANHSRYLFQKLTVYKRSIYCARSESNFRVLSADARTKHGFNASCFVFDEHHAQPDRELTDTMEGSVAARRQPLKVYITTPGWDRTSIAWEKHEYADRVRRGVIRDPHILVVIITAAHLETKDDALWWTRPAAIRAANPGLGVSPKLEFIQREMRKALETPAYENTFKRLHLGIWTQQADRYIPMHLWDRCDGELPLAELEGRECYAGLDLSKSIDLTALMLIFPDAEVGTWWLPFFWMPHRRLRLMERIDRLPYPQWVDAGLIEATPGRVVDYDYVERAITTLAERYDIRDIGYDPKYSHQLVKHLEEREGLTFTAVRQGYAGMAGPMAELKRLLEELRMAHGGHPVLREHADHLAAQVNADGDARPHKANSSGRIDGMAAGLMALARLLDAEADSDDLSGTRVTSVEW